MVHRQSQNRSQPGSPLDKAFKDSLLEKIHSIPGVSAFNLQVESLTLGECVATAPRDPQCDGIFECFHGGVLMTIADMAACFAIMTYSGPHQILSTTDMNIRFLAPCMTLVRAKARVIKPGRLLCPATVELFDENNRLVAVAQVTYVQLDKMPTR